MKGPELVVAGNLLVDDIVLYDGRTLMGEPGGGALYVSLAASLWSVRVGLVSVLGNDYPPHAIEALSAHAVNLEGVRPLDGPSLRTWLLYEPRGRQIVRQLEAQSHAAVSPVITDVPRHFREARLVHVCPMPFEYQSALVAALRDTRGAAGDAPALSLDPHETVREDNLAMWRSVLEAAALFFVSHEELLLEGAATDPQAALRRLGGTRSGQSFLLKRGTEGGLLCDAGADRLTPWVARVSEVVDATGAGDAFAGGCLAGWLRRETWEKALQRGIVSASFAIESWGPRALIAATPAAAERRLLDWYGAGNAAADGSAAASSARDPRAAAGSSRQAHS